MPEAGQTTQLIIDFSILNPPNKFQKAFRDRVSGKKTVYAQKIFSHSLQVKCGGLSVLQREGVIFLFKVNEIKNNKWLQKMIKSKMSVKNRTRQNL